LKIFLIGMPGSGKSTVARHLAKALHQPYIDLDGMIEKDAKMFIEDIFEKYGESKFRSLETEALKKLSKEDAVISCGGGIVTVKSNKALMEGFKIYLDTDLDVIRERLATDYVRPLLKQKSLETIHDERFLKYQDFADLVVSNNQGVEETVKFIQESLKNRGIL
jgi:shikimate kinase